MKPSEELRQLERHFALGSVFPMPQIKTDFNKIIKRVRAQESEIRKLKKQTM